MLKQYQTGAENAKAAGFDGVELHAANGYLINQFLEDNSNHRTDEYGGSYQNRARLLFESLDAVIAGFGNSRRVGECDEKNPREKASIWAGLHVILCLMCGLFFFPSLRRNTNVALVGIP